ncbi:Sugar or nucleoside kinase, ribokinase family [Lentibacillus halodurans]|uniref:Sugar or nucleoside kinase, ribokinase family n=1 Tax=Lentibacillus halodurans TaxID=237679 RepID=A0A1I0X6I8_9BACI|nr:PfkB family carbohydrate kinase [Lentibacillus halodurans]SFA95948.1 Sugar or nucleoside kinase, ribokinase family [Lentibacillus halodurans]
MNDKERKLFQLIKKDPYVSQHELADALGLSRPSIANLISGLIKKGYIRGKAYVLNELDEIVCIGGANVDRKFYVQGDLQQGTSNPVTSTQTAGGVARNIAENLGRLGMNTRLLTVSGMDKDWDYIAEASAPYMNLEGVTRFAEATTGSYTAVLDEARDLIYGLADMESFDLMTPEWLQKQTPALLQAKCILADLNCPKATLSFLAQFSVGHGIPLILVTVSAPKMARLPDNLNGLTWLITNHDESEAYFNGHFSDRDLADQWLELGISNVIITNGKSGAVISNQTDGVYHIPAVETEEIVDVTGAGDAFSAAVTYAWLKGEKLINVANAGVVNAAKTLQSPYTVRPDLSALQLEGDLEELS